MEVIFCDGGRQYRAKQGEAVDVDFREVPEGTSIEFSEVLYLAADGSEPKFGRPRIPGAKVVGRVVGTVQGPKLVVSSFRRRKNSRKKVGHRQSFTRVQIESVQTGTA